MKATERFIRQFEELNMSAIAKLGYGNLVRVRGGYEDYEGTVTKPPFFTCDFACNYPESNDLAANGGWWVKIDGERYSLKDYNIIPNKYNNHSITLIKSREANEKT